MPPFKRQRQLSAGLAYIPRVEEVAKFFQDVYDKSGQLLQRKEGQADAFNTFINQNSYLLSRRGN